MDEQNVLITEEGYEGKFVALPSFLKRTVVASGDDPKTVAQQAREAGYENPVIFFVPHRDVSLVY
jgi:high-affinity K+ transport system ATPase subunit B